MNNIFDLTDDSAQGDNSGGMYCTSINISFSSRRICVWEEELHCLFFTLASLFLSLSPSSSSLN